MKEPMIRAANRQALIDAIESYVVAGGDALDPDAPYLTVEMKECKSVVKYQTEEEIPDTDVPCPCGDPEHWMIVYGKAERPD